MLILIQQYSLTILIDTANYYVNIPNDTTITLLYPLDTTSYYILTSYYVTTQLLKQQAIMLLCYHSYNNPKLQQAYSHIINTTLLSQDTPIDTTIYHVTTLLLIQQANM